MWISAWRQTGTTPTAPSGHRHQQQSERRGQDQQRAGPDDADVELFLHIFPVGALHQVEPEQGDDDGERRTQDEVVQSDYAPDLRHQHQLRSGNCLIRISRLDT
jgi:hypothetical protein